ncbi:MAG: alpha/beta fold hydrolase [Schlesneria sp.]
MTNCYCFNNLHVLALFVIVTGVATLSNGAEDLEELGPPVDVSFTAKLDGTEQHYVIRLPKHFDVNQPHSLLIALHGHGSDRWQFINDARDECRAARDAAAKYQLIYVSPDYRAKTSWMGPAAEKDMLQILDDLHQRFRIENVILCGGSMGGTSALAFAAIHPEVIDAVVSMNGTANLIEYAGFTEAIAAAYGGTRLEQPEVYRTRSAELFPERLTMPIGLTTGGRDVLVPPESTLRLVELLKKRGSPVHSIHRPEGGHDTTYSDAMAALKFAIEKSLQNNLPSKPLLSFDESPKTIVCLGDSVTGVYYHTGGQRAYPELLELGLRQLFPNAGVKVINAGISGQTTVEGLARLERDILGKKPDLVTISFGLNDVTLVAPEKFRENLETLVNRCRARNCQVVLCTPNAVIDTPSRPIQKLVSYCEIIRSVGRDLSVPVCDQYRAGERLRSRAPRTWRLTMSDEIHPNLDGHKRMAEELCLTIAGKSLSLDGIEPPRPVLAHVKALLQKQHTVKVLAMSPYHSMVEVALKSLNPNVIVEVTPWSVQGKSIVALENEAKAMVRTLKPDLVVIAVPGDVAAETDEQFVHSYSWVMNWSLSFGHQEWDCVVADPSVAGSNKISKHDELCRRLVRAQGLELISRPSEDTRAPWELLKDWFAR